MKFTLKDYQEQAVDDVLANLRRARENFKNPDKRQISSFSLTATTGLDALAQLIEPLLP